VDFVHNKIYYSLNRLLQEEGKHIELSEADLRKLSLAGGLMARVGNVDGEIQPEELEVMAEGIRAHWHISREEADLVARWHWRSAAWITPPARHFFECTSEQERLDFLMCLCRRRRCLSPLRRSRIFRTIATILKLRHQTVHRCQADHSSRAALLIDRSPFQVSDSAVFLVTSKLERVVASFLVLVGRLINAIIG
jgi:uncharacterized tellurite resistance protein B-like protein